METAAPPPLQNARDWLALAERLLEERGVPNPRVDAGEILARAAGRPRLDPALLETRLSPGALRRLEGLLARRLAREPLQYVLGRAWFWGRAFAVGPGVLIPRPETEVLVEVCLQEVGGTGRVLDVGTGSGCIAVTLALERPGCRVLAVDRDVRALAAARENVRRHGVASRVALACMDLVAGVRPGIAADLVVANLPYVPSSALPGLQPEVRDFEPASALDGGGDGLALIRRLVPAAVRCLAAGGLLALEIGADQGPAVEALLARTPGLSRVEIRRDLAGRRRVALARRAGP